MLRKHLTHRRKWLPSAAATCNAELPAKLTQFTSTPYFKASLIMALSLRSTAMIRTVFPNSSRAEGINCRLRSAVRTAATLPERTSANSFMFACSSSSNGRGVNPAVYSAKAIRKESEKKAGSRCHGRTLRCQWAVCERSGVRGLRRPCILLP
jgi:hypothetical protein